MPEVYDWTIRKARKPHVCCECSGLIRAGESYYYHHGVWDGTPSTYKVCLKCEEIREYVNRDVDDPEERCAFTELQDWIVCSQDITALADFCENLMRRGAPMAKQLFIRKILHGLIADN